MAWGIPEVFFVIIVSNCSVLRVHGSCESYSTFHRQQKSKKQPFQILPCRRLDQPISEHSRDAAGVLLVPAVRLGRGRVGAPGLQLVAHGGGQAAAEVDVVLAERAVHGVGQLRQVGGVIA